jgi:hypothetical protein
MTLDGAPARDQAASRISAILMRLCESSGALAVALVDGEGETVDYAGKLPPFDTRVAAAEWRLVLAILEESRLESLRATHEMRIRSRGRSYAAVALSDGYVLVFALSRHSFAISYRALDEAARELEAETGLSPRFRADPSQWVRVEVRPTPDNQHRPEAIWHEGGWRAVSVVGKLHPKDLVRGEVGYFARLSNGDDLLLVREPLGRWFLGRPR